MIRSDGLGILQRTNHPTVNSGYRHDHCVLDRTKIFKSFRGKLFRHDHIVFVNRAEHEHEERNNYHYYPRAVYELGSNEDTEHNEGGHGADSIDYDGFLPV